MIVRPQGNWFSMLLAWQGSVLPAILPQLALVLAVSVVALTFGRHIPLDTAPFSLLGVSLAIFLAFRNNASYQRYVEARLLWGQVLNAARALVSQMHSHLGAGRVDHAGAARQVAAFAHVLRHQLRGSDPQADLARLLPAGDAAALALRAYQPVALLDGLRRTIAAAAPDGHAMWMLDAQLTHLSDAVGGCERIAGTPIPYPYGVLLHRTIYAYCFLLPFGLAHATGLAAPLIAVLVAYTLFALEAIAQEISDPFGTEPNSLALEAMCRTIERSVLELSGLAMPPEEAADQAYRLH